LPGDGVGQKRLGRAGQRPLGQRDRLGRDRLVTHVRDREKQQHKQRDERYKGLVGDASRHERNVVLAHLFDDGCPTAVRSLELRSTIVRKTRPPGK
jgi:hypothetical protein